MRAQRDDGAKGGPLRAQREGPLRAQGVPIEGQKGVPIEGPRGAERARGKRAVSSKATNEQLPYQSLSVA